MLALHWRLGDNLHAADQRLAAKAGERQVDVICRLDVRQFDFEQPFVGADGALFRVKVTGLVLSARDEEPLVDPYTLDGALAMLSLKLGALSLNVN